VSPKLKQLSNNKVVGSFPAAAAAAAADVYSAAS